MASSQEYVDFILEQCEGLTARAMMREYVLYYGGKVVGSVYDNRLLVKSIPSAKKLMPDATMELSYEGAKEMLLVADIENRDFLKELFEAMYEELDYLIDDYSSLSVVPVEVKSGKDYTVHSALNTFVQNEDYNIKKAYVVSNERTVQQNGKIIYIPIYYVMFLDANSVVTDTQF